MTEQLPSDNVSSPRRRGWGATQKQPGIFSELSALLKFNSRAAELRREDDLVQLGVVPDVIELYSPVGQEMLLRRLNAGEPVPQMLGKISLGEHEVGRTQR